MPKDVRENLSQLVSRIIKDAPFSLAEVEANSGRRISKGYVSKIMSGSATNITLEKLVALAEGLRTDAQILFAAYYGRPPLKASEPREVAEWNAIEFLSLMQTLAESPRLIEVLILAARLNIKSQDLLVSSLRHLNEAAQAEKGSSKAKKR